ncbi:putative FMN-binding domain-containing protein [Aspergillus transmontanensis]|uniref:Putative FMN-binding domain-containing protein n=1 Tax=Aspergillus transmontanensis TaxID=1034304 RepID=A0A5N6WAC7_9EURO|nr:putative FMN-binding domain-containing protein [Aspergillus transmontanensis]
MNQFNLKHRVFLFFSNISPPDLIIFLPSAHAESDTEVLLNVIKENPIGILITGIQLLLTRFPPMYPCSIRACSLQHRGQRINRPQLRAHIAKQNLQVKAMLETVDGKPPGVLSLDQDVLVIFNGQHDHYVTPKYYTATKPDTGKVVPTWNYSTAQINGKLSLYYNSKTPEAWVFLAKQLHDLSEQCERNIMVFTGGERPQPWKVADAPERYTELMQRNVVGIKIEIGKIEGKFKMSQEMRRGDRDGVIRGGWRGYLCTRSRSEERCMIRRLRS